MKSFSSMANASDKETVLAANTVGEYAFCFEDDMSTLTDKLVDFDIMLRASLDVKLRPNRDMFLNKPQRLRNAYID